MKAFERPTLLTREEAADYLHVATPTLSDWAHRDTGPTYLKVGRCVRYRKEDLAAWLESRTVHATDRQAS